MIERTLARTITSYQQQYPVLAVVGPRQSGKTTLVRSLFPEYTYVTMESIDYRQRAESDPRGFLGDLGDTVILDEIQRVPDIFSYLQEYVDDPGTERQYVLTGSHQFLLMEKISQSLAGRIATFTLFPFSIEELYGSVAKAEGEELISFAEKLPDALVRLQVHEILFTGLYPRIHDRHLEPSKWYETYVQTYIERDVREMINIGDLRQFEMFLKIAAAHSGRILNKAAIANRTGVSEPTVSRWLSVLEASGVLFFVTPHFRNFTKRIVKSPKLYFTDTGLLSFLLGIYNPAQMKAHPLYGEIFETFVVSELMKRITHKGERIGIYYWRDKTGHEIDLLLEHRQTLFPVEIKSSSTYNSDFHKTLRWWMELSDNTNKNGLIIYDGKQVVNRNSTIPCIPWRCIQLIGKE